MNQKGALSKGLIIVLVILGLLIFTAIGLVSKFVGLNNSMVELDEGVKASWAQVENQYQRRADLVPNLVETVKGYASHEKETLVGVTQARSKMGGQVNMGNITKDPAAMARFQKMQAGLSGALSRLMVVAEKYPDLKASQNFSALQAQLEGTENRISVERKRFNDVVMLYNSFIRKIPNNFIAGIAGFTPALSFKAEAGAEKAPKVKF